MSVKQPQIGVRRGILLAALSLRLAYSQPPRMDNEAVIEMLQKRVDAALIIQAIRSAPVVSFTFTTDDYAAFTGAKMTPEILQVMLERQKQAGPVLQVESQAGEVSRSRSGVEPSSALVTFYSAGCVGCLKFLGASLAGSVEMAYFGRIYDGEQPIVKMMKANHFVTFRVTPGRHRFAGRNTYNQGRNQAHELEVDLASGTHSFVRLAMRNSGVHLVRKITPILTVVDCRRAFEEAARAKPISPKDVGGPRGIASIVGNQYFPVCETPVDSAKPHTAINP